MKKKVYIVVSVVTAFLIIAGIMLSMKMTNKDVQNSETIGKVEEIQEESNIQALETNPQVPETWDQTKVTPVLSEDNIYVPVPKGWTISTSEDERYVNGTYIERKISSTVITFFANTSDTSPWTLNGDNIWVSGNKGIKSSTSELLSEEFIVGEEGGYLRIEWSVSSESKWDKLSIMAVNTTTSESIELEEISGTQNGTAYTNLKYEIYEGKLENGIYTLSIKYTKDGSGNSGLDSGYIKSGLIKNFDDTGSESIRVREKSGGFVIYEGEQEITDLLTASKERNQFVWIPVTDPSRIYEIDTTTGKKKAKIYDYDKKTKRTKIDNNSKSNLGREPAILTYRSVGRNR